MLLVQEEPESSVATVRAFSLFHLHLLAAESAFATYFPLLVPPLCSHLINPENPSPLLGSMDSIRSRTLIDVVPQAVLLCTLPTNRWYLVMSIVKSSQRSHLNRERISLTLLFPLQNIPGTASAIASIKSNMREVFNLNVTV